MKRLWILDFGFSIGRSKRKKVFCVALGGLLFALSFPVDAQWRGKVTRLGYLAGASSIHPAFLQGLHDLGYVEGKNIIIEPRYAEGNLDRLHELAAELVRLKVDIIVTQSTPAAQAAKKATSTIPVVMATGGDAVGSGLVASLAHPGGNITGLSTLATDLNEKRLELLKEIVPKASHVAYLANPAIVPEMIGLKVLQAAAPSLGMTIKFAPMQGPRDFESAFAEAVRDRVHAAIFTQNQSTIRIGTRLCRSPQSTVCP
jgi:putative tryptophan/tyrosine transport system substrate-binding protein